MDNQFSESVEAILHAAGWYPGRKVDALSGIVSPFTLFSAAEEVLTEFGGLHFGSCGPGTDCAASDVEIRADFTNHLAPELIRYEQSLNTRLFPIGFFQHGHGYLIIDSDGSIYVLSAMSGEFRPFAPNFSEALESLLFGVKIAPKEEVLTDMFMRLTKMGLMAQQESDNDA